METRCTAYLRCGVISVRHLSLLYNFGQATSFLVFETGCASGQLGESTPRKSLYHSCMKSGSKVVQSSSILIAHAPKNTAFSFYEKIRHGHQEGRANPKPFRQF